MKRKLLWAMAFVGVLALVAGVVLHYLTFPATITTAIAVIHRWIRGVILHVTTPQLVEGAGVAWLVFVLTLVLLARSGRTKSRVHDSQVELPDEATVSGAPPPRAPDVPEVPVYSKIPLLPLSHAEREAPTNNAVLNGNDLHGDPTSIPAAVPVVSDALTRHSIEPKWQSFNVSERQNHPPFPTNRGHVLALTGITQTDGQLQPYGLFLVAEDVPASPGNGIASRRGIEVITEEIAPSLASSAVLKSGQLAALLKMAVMRADLDLREQGIRAATTLEAAITGVMVIGNAVYVVNVGDCRTYLFRPSAGLLQITTAHSVISCLVDSGLLQPDAIYQHPEHDQVYRSLGGSHAAIAVDVFELQVHPDDLVLLCSSGLWHALRRLQIETVLRTAPHPRSAATQLVLEGARCTGGDAFGDDAFNVLVVRPLGEWMPTFGIPASQARVP